MLVSGLDFKGCRRDHMITASLEFTCTSEENGNHVQGEKFTHAQGKVYTSHAFTTGNESSVPLTAASTNQEPKIMALFTRRLFLLGTEKRRR
jgi:hypothetical protein